MEESRRLVAILDKHITRIDHIGSTFVEGLIAKPIVDILLQLKSEADRSVVKDILAKDVWQLMAEDSNSDELTLNKGYTPDGYADRVFHLHVRREGDFDELYFRDYLVSHPEATKKYAKLKLGLLAQYEYDRDAYTEAKSEFVKSCTAIARSGRS